MVESSAQAQAPKDDSQAPAFELLAKKAIKLKNGPDYLGQVDYLGYKALIMTKTGVFGEQVCKLGYLNMTKFTSDFKSKPENQGIVCQEIRKWGSNNKKEASECAQRVISRCLDPDTGFKIKQQDLIIKIEGGNQKQIQGTYFHPDLVIDVLKWSNPVMSDLMNKIIQQHVLEENANNLIPLEEFLEELKTYTPDQQTELIEGRNKILNQQIERTDDFKIKFEKAQERDLLKDKLLGLKNSTISSISESFEETKSNLDKAQAEVNNLKKNADIEGHVYELRMNTEFVDKVDENYIQLMQLLTSQMSYIGQVEREKSDDPINVRFKEHMSDILHVIETFKKTPKNIIMGGIYLLVNKIRKPEFEQFKPEEIFTVTRLNDEIIKKQALLNNEEQRLINERKPVLNTIMYKSYRSDEQITLDELKKQQAKDIKKTQYLNDYAAELKLRKTELDSGVKQPERSRSSSQQKAFLSALKIKKSDTVQKYIETTEKDLIDIKIRAKKTEEDLAALQQPAQADAEVVAEEIAAPRVEEISMPESQPAAVQPVIVQPEVAQPAEAIPQAPVQAPAQAPQAARQESQPRRGRVMQRARDGSNLTQIEEEKKQICQDCNRPFANLKNHKKCKKRT